MPVSSQPSSVAVQLVISPIFYTSTLRQAKSILAAEIEPPVAGYPSVRDRSSQGSLDSNSISSVPGKSTCHYAGECRKEVHLPALRSAR